MQTNNNTYSGDVTTLRDPMKTAKILLPYSLKFILGHFNCFCIASEYERISIQLVLESSLGVGRRMCERKGWEPLYIITRQQFNSNVITCLDLESLNAK